MKKLVCVIVFLMMHAVSYSQVQLFPSRDTSVFRQARIRHIITPVPSGFTFQNKQVIPPDFYAQHLGFFCRQELKMERIHVPVTFRVGTMDQCNYLEQKPGYKIN